MNATTNRTRPYETIQFTTPLEGNGYKLIAHEWIYDWTEAERGDEIVAVRVSNWDECAVSPETGRKICHVFYVYDGTETVTVSAETAAEMLGISTKEISKQEKIQDVRRSVVDGTYSVKSKAARQKVWFEVMDSDSIKAMYDAFISKNADLFASTVFQSGRINKVQSRAMQTGYVFLSGYYGAEAIVRYAISKAA